jgi:hypothetical protein
MVHTVYLDDATIKGFQLDNPATTDVVPAEYMTIEEFRTEAKASLTKILNEYGIHQQTSQS